jgi:hypothetical protein
MLRLLLLVRVFLRGRRLLLGRGIPRAVIGKEGGGRFLLVNHGVPLCVQGDP